MEGKKISSRFSEILTRHNLVSNPVPEFGVSRSFWMYKMLLFLRRRIAAMELEKEIGY